MAILVNVNNSLNIMPSEGRIIISQFEDFDSKLLIVKEFFKDISVSNKIFVTTIDKTNAVIILPKDRDRFINYSQIVEIKNKAHKVVIDRILDLESGYEYFDCKIWDLLENYMYGQHIDAFSKYPKEDIYDAYLNRIETTKLENEMFRKKYIAFSFDEKVEYWSGNLFRQMRWQQESGLDPYAIYDLAWYMNIKITEPEFDKIIELVFSKHWKNIWDISEYRRRLV